MIPVVHLGSVGLGHATPHALGIVADRRQSFLANATGYRIYRHAEEGDFGALDWIIVG